MPTTKEKIEAMQEADDHYRREIAAVARDIRMRRIEIESLEAEHRKTLLDAVKAAGAGADLPLFPAEGAGVEIALGAEVSRRADALPAAGDVAGLPVEVHEAMKAIQDAYNELHALVAKRRNKQICRAHKLWQCMSADEVRALPDLRGPNGSSPPRVVEVYEALVDDYGDDVAFDELIDGKPSVRFARNDDGRYLLYVRANPDDQLYLGTPPPESGGGPYT